MLSIHERREASADEKAFRQAVGRRLRAARKRADKTLQNVADHLGLSKAAVGHWETGTNPPDLGRLFLLARYYKITVHEIVSEPMSKDDLSRILAKAAIELSTPLRQRI